MHPYRRASSAIIATTVVAAGLSTGLATAATAATATTATAAPAAPRLAAAVGTAPVLQGLGQVGSVLTLLLPEDLPLVGTAIEWLRDGTVPVATGGLTYTPTLADVGHTIQARVTPTLAGVPLVPLLTAAVPISAPPGGGTGGTGGGTTTPEVLSGPSIAGIPGVGSLLQVVDPVLSPLPDGLTWSYQWLVDGSPVPGATGQTYVPALPDAGRRLSARATAVLAGVPILSAVTAALPLPEAADEQLTVSTPPALTGAPAEVGRTLSVTDPTWKDAEGVAHTYQWLRGDTPITGATGKSYLLTPDDLDRVVSVAVTGTKEGWTAGTARSSTATVAKGDAPASTVAPSITGTPALGRTLTADPGAWGQGATPAYGYQWRRNGVVVDGATGPTYEVGLRDVAQVLSVTVTATRPASEPGTATSPSVTVARLVGTTRATLAKKRIARGRAAVLRVATRTIGRFVPGRVAVHDGARRLTTVSVEASAARIRLEGLRPGVHELRVVHLGNRYVAPSRSKVLRLVVRR